MIINREDYQKVDGVEYDINKRWEEGTPHHPRSEALYGAISDLDYCFQDDMFGWKSGGDGDNGEALMYLLDIHFDEEDMRNGVVLTIVTSEDDIEEYYPEADCRD